MSRIKTELSEVDYKVILALADARMNISRAARTLNYNRNAIEYHIQSIRDITGLNPKNFHDFLRLYEMAGGTVSERSNIDADR